MKRLLAIMMMLLWTDTALAQSAKEQACLDAYEAKAEEAYELCRPLASSSNPVFKRIMGDFYFFGWEDWLKQDYGEALSWYRRAAVEGDAQARYSMGVIYDNGYGVDEDNEKAFKWYLSAAKAGDIAAQYNVANLYSTGEGVEIDQEQASGWYLRAAKQGDVISQYNIGVRYARGEGVPVNYTAAYGWLLVAYRREMREALDSLRAVSNHMTNAEVVEATEWAEVWSPVAENLQK